MLVRELRRLLDSGEYHRCLMEATALLETGQHKPDELARIYGAICRSRLELTDYAGAVEAGRRAMALAGDRDLWAAAVVDTASALGYMHRYDAAVSLFEQFAAALPECVAARCLEGAAALRSADVLTKAGDERAAAAQYRHARDWFDRFGDDVNAFACVRGLTQLALDQGRIDEGLSLLTEQEEYLERLPHDVGMQSGYLLHRAALALARDQHQHAIDCAFAVLDLADERLEELTRAHLLLCETALAMSEPIDACSFALAARVAAIDGRLYDLEFEASERLFWLIRTYGIDTLTALDGHLQEQGASLYEYISADALSRMAAE